MATCGGPVVDTPVNTSSGGFHKALFPMFQPPAYIYIFMLIIFSEERMTVHFQRQTRERSIIFYKQTSLARPTINFFYSLWHYSLFFFISQALVMFGKKNKRALCLSSSTYLQRAKLKASLTTTLEVDGASFTERQCSFDQMARSAVGVGESNNRRKEGVV